METIWTILKVLIAIYVFWAIYILWFIVRDYRSTVCGKLFAVRRKWYHKLTGRK